MRTNGIMEYVAPEIEFYYVNIEKGFAASSPLEDPEKGWED